MNRLFIFKRTIAALERIGDDMASPTPPPPELGFREEFVRHATFNDAVDRAIAAQFRL
jgi:hypothetical protein